jgi:hypothetical protein
VPGAGRPGDPLWFVIGFAIGVIPGIYFHQLWAGVGIGIVLGGAFGLIRADIRNKNVGRVAPARFAIGVVIGLVCGFCLHYLGLGWLPGIGLGLAFGLFLGAAIGTNNQTSRRG